MLNDKYFDQLSKTLSAKTIGLIGDFCIDIYWHADMTRSELSRETPHYPLPVISERMSLGAAGNVAQNIAALKPERILAVSVYGNDWRGTMLERLLADQNISAGYFVKCDDRFTNAYCKPMRKGISEIIYEDARLDFENYCPIDEATEEKIIENLISISQSIDILCVSDQFRYGVITEKVRKTITDLAKKGLKVVVDSRYNIGKYTDCILKPNEVECWRTVYNNEEYLYAEKNDFIEAAKLLAIRNNATVFCTLGSKGSCITDGSVVNTYDTAEIDGPIDICGAGDTSLSAFSCVLAAGFDYDKAAETAALASGVTIQKIGQTGTAAINEIKELYNKKDLA